MKCFQRVGVAFCKSVKPRPFHSTSVRREMAEFFPSDLQKAWQGEDPSPDTANDKDQGFDSKFGRDWEMSDLETLRNPTLHALWFVLLKERNAMLTADSFFRATLKLRNPYRERLKSVQQSMDNLRQVMEHREHTVTVVKHKAWQAKVAAHLGEEFSEELTRTYLTYNSPTCPAEKESIEKLKRDQMLSPNHERYHQPYEMWDLKLPGEKKEQKVKQVVQYEHDIKKHDMAYKYFNPETWKWERNIREKARKNIIKRNRERFAKTMSPESDDHNVDDDEEDAFESLLKSKTE